MNRIIRKVLTNKPRTRKMPHPFVLMRIQLFGDWGISDIRRFPASRGLVSNLLLLLSSHASAEMDEFSGWKFQPQEMPIWNLIIYLDMVSLSVSGSYNLQILAGFPRHWAIYVLELRVEMRGFSGPESSARASTLNNELGLLGQTID